MKKSFVSLLTIAAITFGMVSCNSSKKQDAAEQKVEEEAAIAGEVSKGLLTAELKDEVTRFLKDMPDSELPYKVSTGEVTISVANTDFMLPVSKVSELNTQAQKARACGIYFADLNVLKAMKKPTTDIENVLVKLTTDLDIPFAIDIMKESAPANASKEELSKFMKDQENKLIDAMMENDKADVELELLGGMAVEYAIVRKASGNTASVVAIIVVGIFVLCVILLLAKGLFASNSSEVPKGINTATINTNESVAEPVNSAAPADTSVTDNSSVDESGAVTDVSSDESSQTDVLDVMYVTEYAYLHVAPDNDAENIVCMSPGVQVNVLEYEDNGYVKINFMNIDGPLTGYIYKDYLTTDSSIAVQW